MREHDDGHGSPPPILLLERRWRDRDALSSDVLEDIDLVCERSAGEHLEDLERAFQAAVRTLFHERLDGGARQSGHRMPPKSGQDYHRTRTSARAVVPLPSPHPALLAPPRLEGFPAREAAAEIR